LRKDAYGGANLYAHQAAIIVTMVAIAIARANRHKRARKQYRRDKANKTGKADRPPLINVDIPFSRAAHAYYPLPNLHIIHTYIIRIYHKNVRVSIPFLKK
jgi:hypothetical protein